TAGWMTIIEIRPFRNGWKSCTTFGCAFQLLSDFVLNPDGVANASHKYGDNVTKEGQLENAPDCFRSGNTGFGDCVWSRAPVVRRHSRHLYCRRCRASRWCYVAWCKRATRLDRSRTAGSSTFRGVQFRRARANPSVVVRAVVLGNRSNHWSVCGQSDSRTGLAWPHRRHCFGRATCLFVMVLHFLFSETAGGQAQSFH